MLKRLFSTPAILTPPAPDAPDEHHIALGNEIEIAFHHATRTVFYIDRTGAADSAALNDLLAWYERQGWFLHAIALSALPPASRQEGNP